MDLNLYNTASRKVEIFVPLKPQNVGIYSCGLTVYYYTHIGNLRAYCNSDILRRSLEYMGFQVRHVMNITDVGHMTSDEDSGEDKLELSARKESKSPLQIARFYERYFFKSLSRINILQPHVKCRATEHIEEMIALIQRLEKKGFTYNTSIGIIFDTSKYPEYDKFARLNLAGQNYGERVDVDPERRNPSDFALWVTNQPNHIMQWDSPWGRGFPGWHIECSAMSMKYLGDEIDIHTGGIDHISVHHTNEIAQSEAATGKRFVRYWFHSAFINIDGQKMSKSLGNLYTLDDIVKQGFSPMSLRYLFLNSSYRKAFNFTWESLSSAQTALLRLWKKYAELGKPLGLPLTSEMQAFNDAICTDLNTSKAISILWDVLYSGKPADKIAATLLAMDQILGLDINNSFKHIEEIKSNNNLLTDKLSIARELFMKRTTLRKCNNYVEADAVKKELLKLGFQVEDTKDGSYLMFKGLLL